MAVRLANNAYSQTTAALTSEDSTLTITAGHGTRFPSLGAGDWFFATLLGMSGAFEIVRVTARVDDVFTIERGAEGTIPMSFSADSRIELRVTTGNIDINNQNVLLL